MTRFLRRVTLIVHRHSAGALAVLVFGIGTAIGAGLYVGADGYCVSATASKSPGPALTASARIVYLDDQGRIMATPEGHLATQQILHQMSAPGAAVSAAFLQAVRSTGGVDVEASTVQLVLQSNSSQGVTIIGIEPVALHRTAPLSGALYLIPPDSSVPVIPMMFDLNELSPVARQVTESASPEPGDPKQHLIFTGTIQPGNPYFDANSIHLTGNESAVINIRMQVTGVYATFNLAIVYIDDANQGAIHTLTLSDNGHPFGVTGVSTGRSEEAASYQQAFQLQGNFSLCQVADPDKIPLSAIASLRCR
jgi:hypothetical protein